MPIKRSLGLSIMQPNVHVIAQHKNVNLISLAFWVSRPPLWVFVSLSPNQASNTPFAIVWFEAWFMQWKKLTKTVTHREFYCFNLGAQRSPKGPTILTAATKCHQNWFTIVAFWGGRFFKWKYEIIIINEHSLRHPISGPVWNWGSTALLKRARQA